MTYNILGIYNLDKMRHANFKMLFKITNNDLVESNLAYIVILKLYSSPSKLSKTIIQYGESAVIINKELVTKFDPFKKLDLVTNRTNAAIEV
jgi:hypothetical protein